VQRLTVQTSGGSYDVVVGAGVLDELPERLDALGQRGTVWLIADAAVYAHQGERIEGTLRQAGRRIQSFAVPSGETSKDLAMATRLYDWMIGGGVERRDMVLALGGGMAGDLGGFVAATVLRGVALVQLPTTLLAMVDSAIGGKTGVNHPLGKNLIGAFHQPRLTLADTETLATLPARELRSGWAEVIKHAVIRDSGLFEQLVDNRGGFGEGTTLPEPSPDIIRRAIKVKVDVVNVDERETGERMLLNYGHTLGHAVEAAAGYGTLLHGEAVAIGMDLEAQLACALGMVDDAMVVRQRALLEAYGLPVHVPAALDTEEIMALALRDKKVRAGKIRWALPTAIGDATIRDDVAEELVRQILRH
jgi:3-dehydroquinate synthase